MKSILRYFELVLGLKVNFFKNSLIGINVEGEGFMGLTEDFLCCCLGTLPFKYLGLSMGANPRYSTTWEAMLATKRVRLVGWRNKWASL